MSDTKVVDWARVASDNPLTSMTTDKKEKSKTVRIEERLLQIVLAMMKDSGADDFSDYIRGLLIEEAINHNIKLEGIDIPGWLVGSRVHFSLNAGREAVPPSAVIERQLEIADQVIEAHAHDPGTEKGKDHRIKKRKA